MAIGVILKLLKWIVLAQCLTLANLVSSSSVIHSGQEMDPEFLAPLENHTITQGRDVQFTCVVNHLGQYKVAWIKSDTKAILAIHTHLVAHNNRLSVTHNGHNAWNLIVSNVQKNDSGTYMCQINTDPMKSQMGNLEVVIPPDIISEEGSDEHVAVEGGTLKVRCKATGIPEPTVLWRRENSSQIVLRQEGREKQVLQKYDGETLLLTNVHRSDMGIYLCIASNGIPPTVSKRFLIQVQFHPTTKVVNQLVAAPVGREVVIQCQVETWPKAMHSWYRDSPSGADEKLMTSLKYLIEEIPVNAYTVLLNLTIRNLEKKDFGGYNCSSVNAIGKSEGVIRLQELHIAPKTTISPIVHHNENHKSRKKIEKPGSHNKEKHSRPRKKPPAYEDAGNEEDMENSLTTLEVRTQTPSVVFTSTAPLWIIPYQEKSSAVHSSQSICVSVICLIILICRTH